MRAWLAMILLVPLPVAAAAPEPFREGVVVDLAVGNASWSAADGGYWFAFVAGPDGAVLGQRAYVAQDAETVPAPACTVAPQRSSDPPRPNACDDGLSRYLPGAGAGTTYVVRNGTVPAVPLVEGSARALLSRLDLHAAPASNGSFARIGTSGTIDHGCRAWHAFAPAFGTGPQPVLSGPITVAVAAPGARIAQLSERLVETRSDRDVLVFPLDGSQGLGEFAQVCAADGPVTYAIKVDRTFAPLESRSRSVVPELGAFAAFALVGAALLIRRGRA